MSEVQENQATEPEIDLQSEVQTEDEVLQNDEPKPVEDIGYSETNSELDAFLLDATTTKEEEHQQGVNDRKAEKLKMSPEEASALAVQGILEVVKFAREETGNDLKVSKTQLVIGSTLFVPAIMKYAPIIQKCIEDMTSGVDEDSYMPEYLAVGGAASLGGLLYLQNRKQGGKKSKPKEPTKDAAKEGSNGDKP